MPVVSNAFSSDAKKVGAIDGKGAGSMVGEANPGRSAVSLGTVSSDNTGYVNP